MGSSESAFNTIVGIINDPAFRAIRESNLTLTVTLEPTIVYNSLNFLMTIIVLPEGKKYEIFENYEIDDDCGHTRAFLRERFYDKCLLFLLYHWKDECKKLIWQE